MPYHIKLVHGNQERLLGETVGLEVTRVPVTSQAASLVEPGVRIELLPSGEVIQLPRDGESVYVMSTAGKTIDAYHWPLRGKEPEVAP